MNALHADLREMGARYRRVIETTPCDLPGAPFNKSLTQRIDWLGANVIAPAEKLLAALDDALLPMFSTWPYEHEFPNPIERERIQIELGALVAFSEKLRRNLRGEKDADAGTNQELRAEIFYDASEALKRHLPDLRPSRGDYDPQLRRYVGRYRA